MWNDCSVAEKCLKWRMLDYQKRFIDNPIADDWNCAMHSNALYQKCSTPEEVVRLPEGKLLRRSTMDDEEALARKADKLAKEQHKVEQSRAKLASGRGSQRLAGQAVSVHHSTLCSQNNCAVALSLSLQTPPSQQLAKARKGMISSQQPRESSASSSSPEPSNRRNGLRQSPSPAHRPKTKASALSEDNTNVPYHKAFAGGTAEGHRGARKEAEIGRRGHGSQTGGRTTAKASGREKTQTRRRAKAGRGREATAGGQESDLWQTVRKYRRR